MFLDPVGTARLFQAGSAAFMNGVAANCALASHITGSMAGASGTRPAAGAPRSRADAAPRRENETRSRSWYRPPPQRARSWYRPPARSGPPNLFAAFSGNNGTFRSAPCFAFGDMPWFSPPTFAGTAGRSPFAGWSGATAWPGLVAGHSRMQEMADMWLRMWSPLQAAGGPTGASWPWQTPLAASAQAARNVRPAALWTGATDVSGSLERTGAAIRRVAAGPAPIPHLSYQAPADQGLAGAAGVPDAMRPWGLLMLAVAVPPSVHDLAMTLAGSAWFRPALGG